MIAALAFTLVAVALGLPGLAVLVMLGLTQYGEKQPSRDRTPGQSAKRHFRVTAGPDRAAFSRSHLRTQRRLNTDS